MNKHLRWASSFFFKVSRASLATAIVLAGIPIDPAIANNGGVDEIESQHLVTKIELPKDPALDLQSIQIELKEVSQEAASSEVAIAVKSKSDTTVFSTDDANLMTVGAAAGQELNAQQEKFFIAPLGEASIATERQPGPLQRAYNDWLKGVTRMVRTDKVGLMIVTFGFAMETVTWLHTAHVSTFEKSANIAYSTAMALAFSINKDTWPRATAPIRKKYRELLKLSEVMPSNATHVDMAKYFGVRLAAHVTLGLGINVGRLLFVSIDKMINSAFDPADLAKPIMVSLIAAMAGMAWSETIASIDPVTHPRAKILVRRFLDMRSITGSLFANTAMLFSFQHYGIRPWLIMTALGVPGYIAFANAKHIADYIERHPTIKRVFDRVHAVKSSIAPRAWLCKELFFEL